MTDIIFSRETSYYNICRFNYLRNEKYFLNFVMHFVNLDSILNISTKKWPSSLMFFWDYRLWKTWLDKSLKSPVSEDPVTSSMVNGRKTVQSWTTVLLPYLLIPMKIIQVEKVSLGDMQNLRTVFNSLTAVKMYYIPNRDNL